MVSYQSLYRRYRPQSFAGIKGQDHVVRALQTAVRTGKVGHAYLLHGPRGSGKTSTARVLAKALNCTDLSDEGEPCCRCESCLSIQQGRSFDLQELDAASNNKVDDMRSLLERVNLTSPGQTKVYLLDEVHMLTPGAENALLKTLEEPPDHVTWVLATTEPHKVVHTIRSRCQVFELGLIGTEVMSGHLRQVVADAGLDIDDEAIDHAVSEGGGSVRDSLTALERIVAGGGTAKLDSSTDAVLAALADRDRAAALSAVGDAMSRGRDPRTIGETALAGLRDAFLTAMGDPPARMSEHERDRAADLAERMAPAAVTRALETLGRTLIDMRQAPDPRIDIEVALMRLCSPDEDHTLEALAHRVRQLEARPAGPPAAPGPGSTLPVPAPAAAPHTAPQPAAAPHTAAPHTAPQPAAAPHTAAPHTAPQPAAAPHTAAPHTAPQPAAAPHTAAPHTAPQPAAAPHTAAPHTAPQPAAAPHTAAPHTAPQPAAAPHTAAPHTAPESAASEREHAPPPDGAAHAAASRPARPAGPADAARRTLQESRSAAVQRQETAATASAAPPPLPPPLPPPPVTDPASMCPASPRQVVELARRYLGLEQDFVVTRAITLEPDKQRRREPAQLQALWSDLVAQAAAASAAATVIEPPAAGTPSEPEPTLRPDPTPRLDLPPGTGTLTGHHPTPQTDTPPRHHPHTETGTSTTDTPPRHHPTPQTDTPPRHHPHTETGTSTTDTPPRHHPTPQTDTPPRHHPHTETGTSTTDTPPGHHPTPQTGAPTRLGSVGATEASPGSDALPGRDVVDGFDLAELDDLAEAPRHAHDIEQKIKAVFGGAEFTLLPEPGVDDADGSS